MCIFMAIFHIRAVTVDININSIFKDLEHAKYTLDGADSVKNFVLCVTWSTHCCSNVITITC